MVLAVLFRAAAALTNVEPLDAAVLTTGCEDERILVKSSQLVASLFAVATKPVLVVHSGRVVDVGELDVARTGARNQLFVAETGQKLGAENVGLVAGSDVGPFLNKQPCSNSSRLAKLSCPRERHSPRWCTVR